MLVPMSKLTNTMSTNTNELDSLINRFLTHKLIDNNEPPPADARQIEF